MRLKSYKFLNFFPSHPPFLPLIIINDKKGEWEGSHSPKLLNRSFLNILPQHLFDSQVVSGRFSETSH